MQVTKVIVLVLLLHQLLYLSEIIVLKGSRRFNPEKKKCYGNEMTAVPKRES